MKKGVILFLFIYLLGGCAQIPPAQNIPWLSHQQQLENLKNWSFSGKLAFITPQERHSLNIHWRQSGNNFHITLTTFLGTSVLDLNKTPSGTKITDNNGNLYFAEDTESLIKQLSGLVIPVEALQQWVKGNPSEASYQLNKDNQVVSLSAVASENASWSVNYSDYKSQQGIYLPHKLQLKKSDLRLKFAISRWQINKAP
ncbi:MAG: lipoprotein insertase outer membrane protein LolB [Psychromonas sp.]|nr:lipoprotein insertase outer membrane protein LolB [Psychromonas sp.]